MADDSSKLGWAIDFAIAELERMGDIDKLPEPVRTVLRVHAAQGVIDNGGLQYFFESDWTEKPPYAEFVHAYRAIGANAEADALAAAVDLFPFADPHLHRERRNEFLDLYEHRPEHGNTNPFERYTDQLCGNKVIWQLLTEYVSAHADSFADRNASDVGRG